ncbi:MAG: SDR family NAD(P)-dependent oxidoreductase [Gammaproteobacteria bacterium]
MTAPSHTLITGTSSGLGHALARTLRDRGWRVHGCSRRGCDLKGIHDRVMDLTDAASVARELAALLEDVPRLDLVVLNAGILGEIRDLTETPLEDVKEVMEVNVWANKSVMDALHAWGRPVGQIIMISSGAAVLGNRGWGGYALSKATLNMLARLYAHEFPNTHIAAVAPGLIGTAMMDYLCEDADAERFPALKRLRDARARDRMPTPDESARRLLSVLDEVRQRPSGDFVDIREILEPAEFQRLFDRSADSAR